MIFITTHYNIPQMTTLTDLPDKLKSHILSYIKTTDFKCEHCGLFLHRCRLSKLSLEIREHYGEFIFHLSNENSNIVCIRCIIRQPSIGFFTKNELITNSKYRSIHGAIQEEKKNWNRRLFKFVFKK